MIIGKINSNCEHGHDMCSSPYLKHMIYTYFPSNKCNYIKPFIISVNLMSYNRKVTHNRIGIKEIKLLSSFLLETQA